MIERLSLNAIKFFYYVGRYQSVTIASEKLFVTQSAVSKQIKSLEDELSVKLIQKSGRNIALTQAGQTLYACCETMFLPLERCLNEITQPKADPSQLVLSCEPTISMKWLIPRLVEFNQQQHGFDIVLLTGGGVVDFVGKGIDLAIRRNDFDWGDHIFAEKLADEYIVAVAKTGNLDYKNLLLTTSRPNLWRQLTHQALLDKSLLNAEKILFEHFYLCIEATLAGLGVAVVSAYMVEKEIANVLLTYQSPPIADNSAYYLLSNHAFSQDKRKVIFKNWLKQEFALSESNLF